MTKDTVRFRDTRVSMTALHYRIIALHYRIIASIIHDSPRLTDEDRYQAAKAFAMGLRKTNPAFDPSRFMEACGYRE